MTATPQQSNPLHRVSVIVPVYNAAATIAESLDTLCAQTHPYWEAIVVDDGSSDGSLEIAQRYAVRDNRIRLLQSEHLGVSAARNAGIHQARYEWLLFLDADDWLKPEYLERMTGVLGDNPDLDAVHCGWARLTSDGRIIKEQLAAGEGDLSSYFEAYCYFTIHACVVRRKIVISVGGFDTSLRTCEDWDLWLRVTRSGARFGLVPEILALYRTRPESASLKAEQLLGDAYRVLERAHSPSAKPADSPREDLQLENLLVKRKYLFLCWCAGLMIGSRADARSLLGEILAQPFPEIDPLEIAMRLFEAILLPDCQPAHTGMEFWLGMASGIYSFLTAFEEKIQSTSLANAVIRRLMRTILMESSEIKPLTIGVSHAERLDVWMPIQDIKLTDEIERLFCSIAIGEEKLSVLELPVFDGYVPAYVLSDAIAAEFAWSILEKYFQATIYASLRLEKNASGLSVWREDVLLANGLPDGEIEWTNHLHERAGWHLFLQEAWGQPDKPLDWFYNPHLVEKSAPGTVFAQDARLSFDISEEPIEVECPESTLWVTFTVSGVGIGVVAVPAGNGKVSAAALRSSLIRAAGFELCRAVVREGLLGRRFDETSSLHERLSDAWRCVVPAPLAAPRAETPAIAVDIHTPGSLELPDGWQNSLRRILGALDEAVVLPRRPGFEIDSSASRRVIFPVSVYHDLNEAAVALGEATIRVGASIEQPVKTIYAPDLLHKGQASSYPLQIALKGKEHPELVQTRQYKRDVFEGLFAAHTDPWNYTAPYEQIKYQQTLSLLPDGRIHSALELGCAEGHFTLQLAPRVDELTAADISNVALRRAAQRCAGFKHIKYLPFDLVRDPLPGRFDLIVCSEVLYYIGDRSKLRATARRLVEALQPGGYLLMAHAHLVVDEPDKPGFDWDHPFGAKTISDVFTAISQLRLDRELRTPLYRIQLYQKRRGGLFTLQKRRRPSVTELAQQPVLPPPGADVQVLWQGGAPRRTETERVEVSERLPILMYHRVAPHGSQALAKYRVTPNQFEEQLGYLHNTGYYSVTIEEWHAAMVEHKPLPGRAVLLSFDDGYQDFSEYAFPLLERYGFSALVFLVAGEIGGSNRWDHHLGETLPLMEWSDIHQLAVSGIQFGSHTTTHPKLTSIPLADVAREAYRSRMILEQELSRAVTSFAYPYGEEDPAVRHLVGGCGFIYGFTGRPGRCSLWDRLLELPRIEMSGLDDFADFVRKLA